MTPSIATPVNRASGDRFQCRRRSQYHCVGMERIRKRVRDQASRRYKVQHQRLNTSVKQKPASDRVLRALAWEDPQLRRVFQDVYPADQLPRSPTKTVRAAYIVNNDPAGEPGQHWLGLWTEKKKCEIFGSYGLPLQVYKDPDLHQWWSQWKYLTRSDMTIQALDSQTCGHYALFILKAGAQGHSYQAFFGALEDSFLRRGHSLSS